MSAEPKFRPSAGWIVVAVLTLAAMVVQLVARHWGDALSSFGYLVAVVLVNVHIYYGQLLEAENADLRHDIDTLLNAARRRYRP